MNDILRRLRQADPLGGEMPPGRPLPPSLAAPQPPAEPSQRRPRRGVLLIVAATICAAGAATALIAMPEQGSDRGSTAGQKEHAAARAHENNIDARAGNTMPSPPPPQKLTPPNIPPVPRVPPTGPTIRFTGIDSSVRGTLRLPATTTEQAHFRFRGLRRRPGHEYGVWMLARNQTAKFLGFLPPTARTDDLVGLPPEWQSYARVVVTTQPRGKRPERPGPTAASAVLP